MKCEKRLLTMDEILFSRSNTARLLFSYRLSWYRKIMKERLLRFKHMIVIITLLIIPTFSVLPGLIAKPFLLVIQPSSEISSFFLISTAVLIHSLYVLWIAMQKEAINGGRYRTYLLTLPIPLFTQRKIDFKLLLVANHLFWLPIVVSFIVAVKSQNTPFLLFLHWFQLTLSLLIAQWLYLHNKWILSGIICIVGSISSSEPAGWMNSLIGIVGSFLILGIGLNEGQSDRLKFLKEQSCRLRFHWKVLSLIKIDYAILFRKYRQETHLRLFFCVLTLIVLYQISIQSTLTIVQTGPIAMALLLLITSGWYRKLALEHNQYILYLNTLSFSKNVKVFLDISVVFSTVLLLQFLFFIRFLILDEYSILKFFYISLIEIPLVAILYLCQTRLSKLCHTTCTTSTGLWLSFLLLYG